MKYFTFRRTSNNFDDILDDSTIKKLVRVKIQWTGNLLIGIMDDKSEQTISYMTLKFGEDFAPEIESFAPVPGKDYVPEKDSSKFKK